MSLFHNARGNIMHFQNSLLTAVGGDQQINGSVTIAGPQHIGSQIVYQGVPLKGTRLRL